MPRLFCRLAADDLGTGHSGMSYLKRFPLDALKIAPSFVADIESDHDSAFIAAAVITLVKGVARVPQGAICVV